jgi:hypothetical protein
MPRRYLGYYEKPCVVYRDGLDKLRYAASGKKIRPLAGAAAGRDNRGGDKST